MTPTICTDAGHGDKNLGTHDGIAVVKNDGSRIWVPDPSGLIEKDMNLGLDNLVHKSMSSVPFDLVRTRSIDVDPTQMERGLVSERHGANFVASWHVNANLSPRVQGAQLYVYPRNKKTKRLAKEFAIPLKQAFGRCKVIEAKKDMGEWIDAPRSILLAHDCDVVLFELGFRSNPQDRAILLDPYGQEAIASVLRWCLVRAAQTYH